MLRTEFYNDFLARDGLDHGINMYVFDGDRDLGDFRIWRAAGRPDFERREIDLLNALEPFLHRAMKRGIHRFEALTKRESDVAVLVARGCTDRDIARLLNIGFATVRTHLNNALRKRCCANRAELAAYVTREKLNG
jgi:DNA-binding NarL/FixJ family response regulator